MGYGTLVSLVFHNLPSLYPSSFCRNDFLYLFHSFFHGESHVKTEVLSLLPTHHYICSLLEPSCGLLLRYDASSSVITSHADQVLEYVLLKVVYKGGEK